MAFIPVILAGGSGSRLWPLSRKSTPKQFLSLLGQENSMLQQTLTRLSALPHGHPIVISNEDHRFLVAEQLRASGFDHSRIILEPVSRNTAPAVALAAATVADDDPVLLVLSADHHIADTQAFQAAISRAVKLAEEGHLVTFGITPTRPETGYGYIRKGTPHHEDSWQIDAFVEKPDLATAQAYLDQGNHLWNSGIFMFRASRYLDELERHAPKIHHQCLAAVQGMVADADFCRIPLAVFSECPEDSIDYAVMEKVSSALTIELDAGWSDIGSWEALWEVAPKDAQGNHTRGDVITEDTNQSLVAAHHRLVATLGVNNLAIVETRDAVLIADKSRSQEVKQVIAQLQRLERDELYRHPHVPRPWGNFDTIDKGPRYQVKRITVQPGEQLSLQLHYHRAEHWIVVSGTARVICGDREMILTENQSTYIPVGVKHRLSNPGKVPLEVIEVQSGDYLGEDDIVRFTDAYGRCESRLD